MPLPEPIHFGEPTRLDLSGHMVSVVAQLTHPRVVVFENVLTYEECDDLMALAAPRLQRSRTVNLQTGGEDVHEARTSEGAYFRRGEDDLLTTLDDRLARLVNWPVDHGEGLQVLRYGVGAEYVPHHDYFDPDYPGATPFIGSAGQRVGTVIVYLNTPVQGGGTVFPDVGLTVMPHKGGAVFFSYDRPHPDTKTLHGGLPVIEGEKWIATKWLREQAA